MFERSDKERLENAEVVLFLDKAGAPKGVRLLPAREVDGWLARADAALKVSADVDFLRARVADETEQLSKLRFTLFVSQHRTAEDLADTFVGGVDATEADIEKAVALVDGLADTLRKKTRELMDAMMDAVASYRPDVLSLETMLNLGVTDEQVCTAFMKLRYFSDPLAAQQSIFGRLQELRRAGLDSPNSRPMKR